MRLKLVAMLAAGLVFELRAPTRVDACGGPMKVASVHSRKVARTSNPSRVLIVGSSARLISNDLREAGHDVEVVGDISAAKRERYGVILVDDNQAAAARERFRNAVVVVRSGSARDDEKTVEERVRPVMVSSATDRSPSSARPRQEPVASGPDRPPPMQLVTAKQCEAVAVPQPTRVPPATTPPAITTTAAPTIEAPGPRAPKTVADRAALHEEIFFATGNKSVKKNGALDRSIAWLTANTAANVVLEGHADPTGTHEGNMALSEERADAVKDYLIGKGIDASRIEVKALGDTELKYGVKDGRNRRVSINATR